MNPAEWLVRTASVYPDAPALFAGDQQVATYGEFAARAGSIAAHLQSQHGIGKGDRVAVFMSNRTEYLEALYGVWFTGAAVIPINAKLHSKEAAWIMENAGAEVVFTSTDIGRSLQEVAPDCVRTIIFADSAAFPALYATPPLSEPAAVHSDDMIWLFYTSGTTGRPKGVMMTAGNIEAMILGYYAGVGQVQREDAILYAAPMSHGAGIYNFMYVIAAARHVCPLSGGFDAEEILDLAPRIKNIGMFAAPTMVHRLVAEAKATGLSGEGLETIIYAGGPMYLADIVEAVEVMGPRFVQIYGQGECPMAITVLSRDLVNDRSHPRWKDRLASVGVAQVGSVVKVVDGDGQDLPVGEIGEIVVAGNGVMKGYWQNETATADTIKDGWLYTGDMGALDEDGFLSLHDRSKDMIISGGSNIYPREVEEVLLHHADVSEVSVVGRPHEDWGEVVVACVVLEAEAELDVPALDQLCIDNIARFKRPKDYIQLDRLPKNNYGKVLKNQLRDMIKDDGTLQ
ncbi:class I adenylate-forming enzyme family protein [Rhodovibrionaceae bacterium A322]